jgi:diguanylate cyclase (GGDEF)-like protein
VYILLLTAKDSRADLVKGFEAGADDFITKPFDPEELRARLRAATRILDLQSALLKAQADLHVLANRDTLTGLFNRRAILETLDRELARSHRDGTSVSVLIADIDHFKRVNDSHGHAAGDAVLVDLADRMKHAVRTYDSVGRYGGEEMLIVLPDCDEEGALHVAERTRESIAARACMVPGAELQVSASLGVASTRALGTFDPKQLIHAADTALYRAKNGGRNRTLVANRDDLA